MIVPKKSSQILEKHDYYALDREEWILLTGTLKNFIKAKIDSTQVTFAIGDTNFGLNWIFPVETLDLLEKGFRMRFE